MRDKKSDKAAAEAHVLYNTIKHVYRLELEFPQPIDKARDWELEVVGAEGKKLEDVTLAYPGLLVPLTEPAPRK